MRVLVTWGSKRGGTEGIARLVAEGLEEEGIDVSLCSARLTPDLARFDAVVVGGALYANRWHPAARRFVVREEKRLRDRPVWFFSSGPLDDSARQSEIPPTKQVRALMDRVGARGHATFGGRLAPDARGFIASKMSKTRAGDWRNPAQVQAWTASIAAELKAAPQRREYFASPSQKASPRLLAVLCFSVALTAIGGGLALVWQPDGSLIHAPLSLLAHTPFHDFLIPGLVLAGVVGVSNLFAAVRLARRHAQANRSAMLSGAILAMWIVMEMILIRQLHWLQGVYLILGFAIVGIATRGPHFDGQRASSPQRALRQP